MRDILTNLYSKNWLYELLPKEMSRNRRYKANFCLCIGKINSFKLLKQHMGDISGERLISILSNIIIANSRKSDFCCRYNNSFAIILPDTPSNGGLIYTKRIDEILEQKNFFYDDSRKNIYLNWGVCEFHPSKHPTAGELVDSVFEKLKVQAG